MIKCKTILACPQINENTSRFSLFPELQLDPLTQSMDPPEGGKKTNIIKHIKTNQIEFS